MEEGNFKIKIKNHSDSDSVYYMRWVPSNGNEEVHIVKNSFRIDDDLSAPLNELKFDLYRKDANQNKIAVVFKDIKVKEPCQIAVYIKQVNDGEVSRVDIKYAEAVDPLSIDPQSEPNVEAGIKE